ncbi:hypothetical protein GBA52_013591 [Prunus armeniaca]|nr:hypothetical protein GBA52_013591 [Prunus armeniaca]
MIETLQDLPKRITSGLYEVKRAPSKENNHFVPLVYYLAGYYIPAEISVGPPHIQFWFHLRQQQQQQ